MKKTLVASEPSEGTINGRWIGIYATDEHDGFDLVLFRQNPNAEHGTDELCEWKIPDLVDAKQVAKNLLLDSLPTAGTA